MIAGFADFIKGSSSIAKIATRTGEDLEDIQARYANFVSELSNETTVGVDLVADGVQKAISALPGATDDAVKELARTGARFVAAGLGEDIGVGVSAATTFMVAFGIEGEHAFDVIARSAQIGEGDVADYANALKSLSQIAGQTGLRMTPEETAAVLSTMSTITRDVTTAERQVQATLAQLFMTQQAGSVQAKALEEMTGGTITGEDMERRIASGDFAGVMRDMQVAMLRDIDPDLLQEFFDTGDISLIPEDLETSVGKAMNIFRDRQALQFILSFDATMFEEKVSDLEASAGTVEAAYEDMTTMLGFQMKRAMGVMGKMYKDFIGKNAHVIETVINWGYRWFNFVVELEGPLGRVRDLFFFLGPALLIVGGGLKLVSILLGGYITAMHAASWVTTLFTGRLATQQVVQNGELVTIQRNTAALWLNTYAKRAAAATSAILSGIVAAWSAAIAWNTALTLGQNLAMKGQLLLQGILATGTWLLTAAQWALNTALSANPITWVVLGVVALVAVLVLLYRRSETARTVFRALGKTFVRLLTPLKWLLQGLMKIFGVLGTVLGWLGDLYGFGGDEIVPEVKEPDQVTVDVLQNPDNFTPHINTPPAIEVPLTIKPDDKVDEPFILPGEEPSSWGDAVWNWARRKMGAGSGSKQGKETFGSILSEQLGRRLEGSQGMQTYARRWLEESGWLDEGASQEELFSTFQKAASSYLGDSPTGETIAGFGQETLGMPSWIYEDTFDVALSNAKLAVQWRAEHNQKLEEAQRAIANTAQRIAVPARSERGGFMSGLHNMEDSFRRFMGFGQGDTLDSLAAGHAMDYAPFAHVQTAEDIIPQLPVAPSPRAHIALNPFAGGQGGGGNSVSVSIDRIEVVTQATDAESIAAEIPPYLEEAIRVAGESIDDDVAP